MTELEWTDLFVRRYTELRGADAEPGAIRMLSRQVYLVRRGIDPWVAAERDFASAMTLGPEDELPPTAAATLVHLPRAGSRRYIIVADDHDHCAKVIAGLLEGSTTYEVEAALNGQAALRCACKRRPDAVLLDIEMPHIGGIGAAQALRAMFAEQQPLLIGMAAGGQGWAAQEAHVFDHLLTRPIDLRTVFELLHRWI